MRPALPAFLALLLACSILLGAAQDSQQAALLSLPRATINWDAATAALNGAAWQAGTSPCGGGGSAAWKGVTCGGSGAADDAVTQLQLPRLGLQGTLPGELAQLPSLTLLDLSGNAFEGGIPEAWLGPNGFPSLATALLGRNKLQGAPLPSDLLSLASQRIDIGGNNFNGSLPANWSSPSLLDLDLRDNQLTGELPSSWGDSAALPQLALLHLQGNNLSGLVPAAWTSGAFAAPLMMESRPGNEQLCGPVVPLDPTLFPEGHPERNSPIIPAANSMRTGNNLTTVVLIQRGLFLPTTSVTITNWLGSCAVPCNAAPGWPAAPADVAAAGLAWPPTVSTNIFDVSWVYNMSISDLVVLNRNAASLRPGAALTVPCYPAGKAALFDYYGGSVAFGQFAGGNQQAGQGGNVTSDSLPGAMAAARINGGVPNQFHPPSIYIGSVAPAVNGSGNGQVSEPVYWFVDMLAPFQVVSVMVTAGIEMRNTSIYIGSDPSSVFANTLVASGLALAAGQQKALPGGGTVGRYVIIYTGTTQQGTLGLDDIQVYAFETNAAANKAVTASGLGGLSSTAASLQSLADNNASSCIVVKSAAADNAANNGTAGLLRVDLGYVGIVGSMAIKAGLNSSGQHSVRFYVTRTADESPSDAQACSAEPRTVAPGEWAVNACNKEGRYIIAKLCSLTQPGDFLELCELQAALTMQPKGNSSSGSSSSDDSSSSSVNVGLVVGIVIGSLAAVALLLLVASYLRWRRRWLEQQRLQREVVEAEAAAAKEGHTPDVPALPPTTKYAAWEVKEYGGGDEEEGGEAAMAANGGASGSDGTEGGDVTAAAAAAAAATAAAAAAGAVEERESEFELIKRFIKTLRPGRKMASLSELESEESRSRRRAGFRVIKGGAAGSGIDTNTVTDLTKLPPGFLEVSPADIRLVECIGEGSFGEVWLAEYCGALVAVKILAKIKSDFMTHSMQQELALRNLKKEAMLMSKLRHPNVCLYLGAVSNPPCLVMEYCAKCSLDHLLRAGLASPAMAKRLPWVRLLSMALDAAKGMLYLHSRSPPIAHRDLKSGNLLVDSLWHVKVADFSLSRALEMGAVAYTVVSTNPRWLAPEVLSGHPGQLPADVWAFGTVLWELFTWRLPFEDLNTFQIIAKVQSEGSAGLHIPPPEELPAGPFSCYPQYVELMNACWSVDAEQRPTFSTIVQQLGTMLATELAVLQAGGSANGHAYAAMAARLAQQQQQDMRRLSDTSRSHSSHGGSLRSSVAAGGSVGSSTTGPRSPGAGSGRGGGSGRGFSGSGRGPGSNSSGRGANGGLPVIPAAGRSPPDARSS